MNPVPAGIVPPMVQGTESDTSGEATIGEPVNTVASRQQDEEITRPELGGDVIEGGMVNGGTGDAPSNADRSPMMYSEKPSVSGGWSPSRIMD